jgi:hypothetical protein
MGFVRTVAQRTVASDIDTAVKRRNREADFDSAPHLEARGLNPEAMALAREKAQMVQTALTSFSRRDREILERFYLKEQSQEQICWEMNLTETQFRLYKSRAKAKFGAIGQKKANRSGVPCLREAGYRPRSPLECSSWFVEGFYGMSSRLGGRCSAYSLRWSGPARQLTCR